MININHLEGNFIDTYSEKDFFFTHIKNDSNKKNLFELSGHYHPKYALKVNKLSYYYKCLQKLKKKYSKLMLKLKKYHQTIKPHVYERYYHLDDQ